MESRSQGSGDCSGGMMTDEEKVACEALFAAIERVRALSAARVANGTARYSEHWTMYDSFRLFAHATRAQRNFEDPKPAADEEWGEYTCREDHTPDE